MMNVLSRFIQLDCKDGQLTKLSEKQAEHKNTIAFFVGFVLFCLAIGIRIDGRSRITTTKPILLLRVW